MASQGTCWAVGPDAPMQLVSTPALTRGVNANIAVTIGTEMALVHNCLMRGFNSIYLSAPYVASPQDVKDFLAFIACWLSATHHHHNSEESIFFPEVEAMIQQPGFMDRNKAQHKAFEAGLEELQKFADETKPEAYKSVDLIAILDSFKEPLAQHLTEEIGTCLELEKYDQEPLAVIWKNLEKKAQGVAKDRVYPFMMSCHDKTFEDGMHYFPPVPWFMAFILKWTLARKHAGAWRFSPCDIYGQPKPREFGPKE